VSSLLSLIFIVSSVSTLLQMDDLVLVIYFITNVASVNGKGKALPVTGREGPYCCKVSTLPHFLDNRLTDGGEVFSLTHRPPLIPREDSWYSYLLEAESTPGP
jgi:hypothetical protein